MKKQELKTKQLDQFTIIENWEKDSVQIEKIDLGSTNYTEYLDSISNMISESKMPPAQKTDIRNEFKTQFLKIHLEHLNELTPLQSKSENQNREIQKLMFHNINESHLKLTVIQIKDSFFEVSRLMRELDLIITQKELKDWSHGSTITTDMIEKIKHKNARRLTNIKLVDEFDSLVKLINYLLFKNIFEIAGHRVVLSNKITESMFQYLEHLVVKQVEIKSKSIKNKINLELQLTLYKNKRKKFLEDELKVIKKSVDFEALTKNKLPNLWKDNIVTKVVTISDYIELSTTNQISMPLCLPDIEKWIEEAKVSEMIIFINKLHDDQIKSATNSFSSKYTNGFESKLAPKQIDSLYLALRGTYIHDDTDIKYFRAIFKNKSIKNFKPIVWIRIQPKNKKQVNKKALIDLLELAGTKRDSINFISKISAIFVDKDDNPIVIKQLYDNKSGDNSDDYEELAHIFSNL